MKALVVYDSVYGNCEKISQEIAKATGTKAIRAGQANASLDGIDLLIVGSPTHGGRPVESVKSFLEKVPQGTLKGKKAAAFDTRASMKSQGRFVKSLVGILGHAAPRIAKELQKKGAAITAEPQGFSVKGTEGPLEEGELKRASEWAEKLCKRIAILDHGELIVLDETKKLLSDQKSKNLEEVFLKLTQSTEVQV